MLTQTNKQHFHTLRETIILFPSSVLFKWVTITALKCLWLDDFVNDSKQKMCQYYVGVITFLGDARLCFLDSSHRSEPSEDHAGFVGWLQIEPSTIRAQWSQFAEWTFHFKVQIKIYFLEVLHNFPPVTCHVNPLFGANHH